MPAAAAQGGYVMRGVQFLVDKKGERTAVLIDLRRHSELWEDFYDRAVALQRAREPRETLASVKKRLSRRAQRRRND
jgi:hypothetical protein